MKKFIGFITKPIVLAAIIISVATLWLFAPILRGEVPLPTRSTSGLTWGQPAQDAITSIFRDRIVQSYPYHLFAAAKIQHGQLPLWNDLIFAGTPFMANGQAGIFSLFKLPWWWLPPWLSYSIVTILQSIVAGLGMFVLGRKLGWRTAPAIISGLALTLSAPFVMRLTVTTMSAVIACLPWIMWAILRLHEQLTWRRAAVLSALVAAAILSGHVQLAAFILVYSAIWTLIWWRKELFGKRTLLFGVGFALGLAITAVQLIPVKEALDQAYRQPSHRSWSSVLAPKNLFKIDKKSAAGLVSTISPNIWGNEAHYRGPANYLEGNLFIGPIMLLLALASLLAWRKRYWRWLALLALLQAGLFIFPGWWSLIGKLAPWITVTPVWRTSFMFIFTLSMLAGLGAQELVGKRAAWRQWSLVGVITVTMLWQWWGILPFAPRSTLFPADPLLTTATAVTANGDKILPVNGALDQFMPYDIPIVFGYDSVYPANYLELWKANSEIRKLNQLHTRNFNTQVLDVTGGNLMLVHYELPTGWTKIAESAGWILAHRDGATSPIHAVTKVISSDDPAELKNIDPQTEALVSGAAPSVDANNNATVKIVSKNSTSLSLSVNSTGSTVVVTNWQWYPGWKFYIDGKLATAALLRVNSDFLGAAVNAGQHEIIFKYQPSSVKIGGIVSGLALLVLLLIFIITNRQKQNHPAASGVE